MQVHIPKVVQQHVLLVDLDTFHLMMVLHLAHHVHLERMRRLLDQRVAQHVQLGRMQSLLDLRSVLHVKLGHLVQHLDWINAQFVHLIHIPQVVHHLVNRVQQEVLQVKLHKQTTTPKIPSMAKLCKSSRSK